MDIELEDDADDAEVVPSIPLEVIRRFGPVSGELARQFANRLQNDLVEALPAQARINLVRAVSDATALALQAARDARR